MIPVRQVRPVVIAGAGPVGLMVALLLSQRGIPVVVLEAESAIVSSPRAIAYQFVTVELLSRAGVLGEALSAGFTRQISHVRTRDGIVATTDLSVIQDDTAYPYILHLPQHVLAGILLDRLRRMRVAVRWATRVAGLTQDDSGVTVTVKDGAGSSQLIAAWLVAADGGRSTVRKACNLSFEGITWPEQFVATDAYCDLEAAGFACANFVHDPDHWAIMTKIANDGLWRIVYGEPAEATREEIVGRSAEKLARILPAGTAFEVTMAAPYRVHQRSAERYRQGRVLLAGDAAHVTNPVGGLGLTSGLLDAEALSDALGSVVLGKNTDAVLDDYAQDRKAIFLNVTSPMATEGKRRMMERDCARRSADIAALRKLNEDSSLQRQAFLNIGRLKGKSFALA